MKDLGLMYKGKRMLCLIDDEDWDRVNEYKWYIFKQGYTYYIIKTERNRTIFLHRFILGIWQRGVDVVS